MSIESRLICQVCKHDHNEPNRIWCDRSDLEIKYQVLEQKLALAVREFKNIGTYPGEDIKWLKYLADQALARINHDTQKESDK